MHIKCPCIISATYEHSTCYYVSKQHRSMCAIQLRLEILNNWIVSICADSTIIVAITCHFEETVFTPFASPAIFHDVIITFFIAAIANRQHIVIYCCGTVWLIVRSTHLIFQSQRMDTNCDRSNGCNRICQCYFILGQSNIISDCGNCIFWIIFAVTFFPGVWISR